MKKRVMLILSCLLLSIGFISAQTKTASGRVVDYSGEPVVGASVIVKNTQIGVSTDVDGKFSIEVPAGKEILRFSLIGMKTIELKAAVNMQVVMDDETQELDPILVVAYGTVKKSSFTGSANVISSNAIEKTSVTSFEKALQGASPGLQIRSISDQPGSATSVRVRGVGSITGSSAPLYVIDGVPISSENKSKIANEDSYGTTTSPLASINPNDIESVTILKDASASSLYGSRAANGVILITTKKGRSGAAKVTFRSQFTAQRIQKNTGYDLMSGTEHYKQTFLGYIASGKNAPDANNLVQKLYRRNPYNVESPLDEYGNLISIIDDNDNLIEAKLMIDTDWIDQLYRTGNGQDYNVDISGGNNSNRYFVSLGYLKQKGTLVGSDFERFSGRVNLDTEVKKWLKMGVNSMFSISNQKTPPAGGGGASPLVHGLTMPNTIPVYDLDKDFNIMYDEEGQPLYNWTNPIFQDMNAVALTKMDKYLTKSYRTLVNPWVNVEIADRLNWKTSLSVDYTNMDETRWYNPYHGNGSNVDGRLSRYSTWILNTLFSTNATYDLYINKVNHFNFLAGYELTNEKYRYIHAQAIGFPPFSDLIELDMGATPKTTQSNTTKEVLLSYLARINYDYNDKYYASFSFRRDGSSKFGKDNRYGNFWSIGGSWRINKEVFMQPTNNWLRDLKLKASFGTNGSNEGIDRYAAQDLFESGSYDGMPGVLHSQFGNPKLSWEESQVLNIGVDFNLFDRLSASFEFFNKSTRKILLKRPIPLSSGLNTVYENVGRMRNRGIEVELTSKNIITKDFTWTTSLNLTHISNKITSYPQDQEVVGTKIRQVGYSLYEFYMPDWAGVDEATGDPLWYMDTTDSEGNIVKTTTNKYLKATKYKKGSSLPSVNGGLSNSFTFKDFDLSFMFTYSFGGKVYDQNMEYFLNDGNKMGYQLIKDAKDSWTPENNRAKNPKFISNNTSNSNKRSSRFLYDADFIKFRNLNLGYTLPKKITSKFGVDNLRFTAGVDNLFIWNLDSDFKGYDVEQGDINGVISSGGTYIPSRTFTFGLSVNF